MKHIKKILYTTLYFYYMQLNAMIIHEYFKDIFAFNALSPKNNCPMQTETLAYQLLKKFPLTVTINYLAIPWYSVTKRYLEQVPTIQLHGGFTISHGIDFLKIVPTLNKIGINVLFATHTPKHLAFKKVNNVLIVPFPHAPLFIIEPNKKKDLLYSFIGAETHPVRKKIFDMKHIKNSVIKRRNKWHPFSEEYEKYTKEYSNILSRSRFSLCPRGTGPNSIRFWESLHAGAIPILLSDEMTLPLGFDWTNCFVQIPEKEVDNFKEILKKISPAEEEKMRDRCYNAAKAFSYDNFINPIRIYYNEAS